jgi:uracil-DNA glycosylase family 4
MNDLYNQIKQCSKCELRCNQLPLIDKPTDASIFWVGLSAVKVIDVNNEIPLSSKTNSGKLILNIESMCKSTLFYKTNVVKCLPLKDGKIRYPTKIEMTNCFHNFNSEIMNIQPKIVFLLGKQVSDFICKKLNIETEKLDNEFNYSTFKKKNIIYVPIHHPSYILVYKRKKIDNYMSKIVELINTTKI